VHLAVGERYSLLHLGEQVVRLVSLSGTGTISAVATNTDGSPIPALRDLALVVDRYTDCSSDRSERG
jgi:hypothetical protein